MQVELCGGAGEMLIQDTCRRTFRTLVSGAIAQLVERYNGIVEVRGSTPLGSTSAADAAKRVRQLSFPGSALDLLACAAACRLSRQVTGQAQKALLSVLCMIYGGR